MMSSSKNTHLMDFCRVCGVGGEEWAPRPARRYLRSRKVITAAAAAVST